MNQHAYKLVFNQKRGMLVAVSEVAVNHSKEPSSGQTQGSSGHTSGTAQRIKHGMVMLLMAFQIWQPLLAAPVAITPDNTQAGSKPTVSAANNGVPVVNIIAPNAQGVSINQYINYNVPTVGLILNNSGGTSLTQLGGYIQGNPMLGNRAASTIVNQVNGPNRSLILGAQEIAGQRANLILANQNGVSINGGSFINTANVTLTTGAPQYNNGALAGYAVKDGLIDVGAGGLDASTTDKLTILTRAAQINGQIWAKQAELITGQNQISFDAQGNPQATANPLSTGTTPSYALDVSAVGGMYAGQMRIIGTEQGLGVNNAGQLVSAGELSLDAQGNLTNSGRMDSGADSHLQVAALDNSGQISAVNNLTLNNQTHLSNSGQLMAGSVQIDTHSLNNTGTLNQTGVQSMDITAQNLNNTGTVGITADTSTPTMDPSTGQAQVSNSSAPQTSTGETANSAGQITTNPAVLNDGYIHVAQDLNNSGQLLTAGALTVHVADTLSNTGAVRTADALNLKAQQIDNQTAATIASQTSANIHASALNNQGQLQAQTLTATADTLDNRQGSITGEQSLSLNASQTIDNTQGKIESGALTLNATQLNNTSGAIIAQGASNLSAAHINNTQGLVFSTAAQGIQTQQLTNTAGLIQGQTLNIQAAQIDNNAAMVNQTAVSGTLIGVDGLSISGNIQLNNNGGMIQSKQLTIDSQTVHNQAGQLTATQNLSLHADSLDNQKGLVYANQTADLTVGTIDNQNTADSPQTGIQAQTVAVQGNTTLNNTSGQIIGDTIQVGTQSLNNSSGFVVGNTVNLNATQLNNQNGTVLADQLNLTSSNYTHQGTISVNDAASLNLTGDFTNQGTLEALGDLSLHTDGNITNATGSTLSADHTLALAGQNITNQSAANIHATHTQLTAQDSIVNDGTIDGGLTELRAGNQIINNNKIYGGDFNGNGGILIGTGNLINNTNAVIASRADMNIGVVSIINNFQGLIQTQGDLSIGRTLGNAAQNYAVSGMADTLTNNSGRVEVGGDVPVWNVTQTLNRNTQFAVQAGGNTTTQPYSYYIVDGQQLDANGNYHFNAQNTFWYKDGFTGFYDGDGKTMHEAYMSNLNLYHYDPRYIAFESGGAGGTVYRLILNPTYTFSEYSPLDLRKWNPYLGDFDNKLNSWDKWVVGVDYSISNKDGSKTNLTSDELQQEYGWIAPNWLSSIIEPQYINLAYNPKGVYSFKYENYCWAVAEGGETACDYGTYQQYFLDTFTYQKDDAIWSKFGVAAPTSNAPEYPNIVDSIIAPDKYNTQLSAYQSWADQNRDTYIALNRKISEFNADWNNHVVWDFDAFNGTATTTTPAVLSSAPAQIIVGGNMNLSGHITNDKSQIVIGGSLLGNVTGIDNDNTGAIAQVTTSYAGSLQEIRNGLIINSIAANPAPTIETVNLSVAQVQTNVGSQNIASAAGTPNGSGTATDIAAPAQIQTVPTDNGQEIRTVAFNGILPSNVLFNMANDPNANYIVETDPQYTNKQQFLSSNYLLQQYDPDHIWKRIGDGYYEQKLITDQIITATGKRYVGDYSNNEAQYKALMDNGLAVGKAFSLTVGTALTAEQMSQLTTDIIWMVEETVTLADGTKVKALVPRVYLTSNRLDLKGDGTLIASKNNFLNVTGDVNNNGGTIAAFNAMNLAANTINNNGGTIGGNKGSDITLHTTHDLNNIGGTVRGGNLALDVGGNLNSITTTYHTQTGDMNLKDRRNYASVRDDIDQVASIQALDGNHSFKDAQGNTYSQTALNIQVGGDANLKASSVSSAGDAYTSAQNINLSTVDTGFAENAVYNWSKKNKHRTERSDTAEVGSAIVATGDNIVVAEDAVNIRAGSLIADQALIVAADRINVDAGRATHDDYSETYTKKTGFLSSSTSHSISQNHADTTVGSQLVGDTVTTLSTGDTTIKGSTVFGTNGVDMISTDGNINLQTSEDRFNNYNYRKDTKSGFGALGGLSFGKMSNEQGRTGDQIGHTGSTIASLNGDVNLSARQGSINVQASDINSQNANVDLQAQQINLTDVHNTATVDQYTKYKSAGLSVSASVAGINAVQNTAQAADLLGQAANGSQSIAAGASTALAAYGAYREVKGLVKGISGLASADSIAATDVAKALGASVSVSLGVQKSESKSHSEQSTSMGSSVTAGGTVNLTATGKGADSDINLTNATVAGAQGTHLKAEGDILAQAGVNTARIDSSNKSSGASIGVSFGANGFTLNLSANGGKGIANGDETTYSETTIGSTGSTTTLTSGGDTTLDGAIVQGKHVKADVGGNLTINTPQDVSHYDSKQTSYGVGVSIPLGAGAFGVSGSYSNDKVNANTTTTKEIAGIYAGEGGYDIQVKGNTTLDAGVIASTATPDNNQLTTSTLVLKDKTNQSAYDADSVGLSASYTSDSSKGLNGWNASPPSAMGASDDASSTSRAAISAGNIRITNDAAQQQLTGQTAEQTLAGLNHDTANNATLANLYEQDKESIQTGFAIGRGLSQNFATFMNYMAQDMDSVANAPAVDKNGNPIEKDGKRLTNQEAYQAGFELGDTVNAAGESINYGTRQDLWGSGGTGNRIATALIGAYSGNVSNGASTLLQNAAINVVRSYGATEIKYLADGFSTETDEKGNPIPNATSETVRGLLHAIAGCAGASATGGDCASAGLASAGTVAMNNAMTALLNLNPNEMTDTQKQAYSNLIGTLVTGVSTAVGGDAAAAQLASKVEVEDNYLDPIQRTWGFDVVNNQLARLQGHNLTREQYEAQLLKLTPTSEKMNEKMIADCLGGKASCTKEKADAQDYISWIKAMEAQGKLTPGKFGNGTLEALAQVEAINKAPEVNKKPVQNSLVTPTNEYYHVTEEQLREATCKIAGVTSYCEPKPDTGNIPIPVGLNAGGAAFGAEAGASINLLNGQFFANGGGSVPISQEGDVSLILVPYKYLTEINYKNKNLGLSDLGRAAYNVDQILNGGGVSATGCLTAVCLGANHSFSKDDETGIYDGKTIYTFGFGTGYKFGTGYSVPVSTPFWGDSSFTKGKLND